MRRKLAISMLAIVVLVAGIIALLTLLPKRYMVGDRLSQATVFWNDKEAFIFVDIMSLGRTQNAVDDKIASSRFGYLTALGGMDFVQQRPTAYHLLPSGRLDQPPLPQGVSLLGTWGLVNGKLQLTTIANNYRSFPGFRWDGDKFEAVTPQIRSTTFRSAQNTNLSEDDPDPDGDETPGFLDKQQRKAFKDAGWHFKFITGYEGANGAATLPMALGKSKYDLVVRSTSPRDVAKASYGFLDGGATQLDLSGARLAAGSVLWRQAGWQEISKADYEKRVLQSGQQRQLPKTVWLWLVVALLVGVWKLYAWASMIFSFVSVKRKIVGQMPSSYSFPPVLPAQFPLLDTAALERYTRDLEALGFTRLLDTSPTTDVANRPVSFCRVLVHTAHHCFAEVSQIFVKGKPSLPMRCAIISYLQDGWSIGFSNRKPLAASHLVRRPKGLGVSMPEASPTELLQSLLTMRQQVCVDLSLASLAQDTVEGYIASTQQVAADLRAAVQKKNFFTGIPQYYYRKLALIKTKPEYVWLGDYPKTAEQRKQTYGLAPAM